MALVTLILLMVVILPVSFTVAAQVRIADANATLPDAAATFRLPPPLPRGSPVPVIGTPVADQWRLLAASNTGEIIAQVRPQLRTIAHCWSAPRAAWAA